MLRKLVGNDLGVIRSSVLKKALQENDALVLEVMTRAAEFIGEACLQIRHLLDPEVIVLGGGVVEACKPYILPIVQRAYTGDSMNRGQASGKVVASSLGDDAVVLGGVALAQQGMGRDPFKKARRTIQRYPTLSGLDAKGVIVGDVPCTDDFYIRVDGKVHPRTKALALSEAGPNVIDAAQLKVVCKGKPSILIIGTGQKQPATLTADAENFLRHRGVTYEVLSTTEAVAAYNAIKGRKALLLRIA